MSGCKPIDLPVSSMVKNNKSLEERIKEIEEKLQAWNEDLDYLDSLELNKRIKKLFKKNKQVCGILDLHNIAFSQHKEKINKLQDMINMEDRTDLSLSEDDKNRNISIEKMICPTCNDYFQNKD